MKKSALLFVIILLCGIGFSQCPENPVFTSQEDVDNYFINYPGCDQITGSLLIDNSNINNLEGLMGLKNIGNDVSIHSLDSLTSLSGLDSLESIGGTLQILYCPVSFPVF